jgi:hypothetical protein
MIELLTKLLKDLKVLVGISVALNLALVAITLRGADDVRVKFGGNEVVLKTVTLTEHFEALFRDRTERQLVRALLEEKHFFEIGPDNPRAESIAVALMNLAERHSAHALVSQLREMSRRLTGPFKGLESYALVEKNDFHVSSQGIARVCRGSGFEDMYLMIFGTGHPQRSVTVHAEKQRDCPEKMREVVELHSDDWNKLFDETDAASQRSVIVGLHPPRFETQVDARLRHVSGLTTPSK